MSGSVVMKPVILQIFQTLRGPPFFIPDSIGHLYVSCTWAWDLSTGPLMPPMLKAKLVFSCTCYYLFVWSWIFGNNAHLLSTRLEWCFSYSRVQLVIEIPSPSISFALGFVWFLHLLISIRVFLLLHVFIIYLLDSRADQLAAVL